MIETGYEQKLRQILEQQRDLKQGNFPADYAYSGMEDFLLRHGVWHRSDGQPSFQGKRGVCFGNALMIAAVNGWPYIEGVALPVSEKEPIHHAWNLHPNGELIDVTWMNQGLAYLGVEFSVGRADNATWFDNASVLDNHGKRNRLYRQPWRGENFNLIWRKSKYTRQLLKARQ
jgi:hypothetical protein